MEFPELETHCSLPSCQQVDFLPFQCDCCHNVYCLEHRKYSAHSCSKSGNKDCQVLVCPLCAKAVKLVPGEDPNITFENHTRTGCDQTNYRRVTEKPRCPVQGCKEKLTFSNCHTCKDCRVKVCLKHRFPTDHTCAKLTPPAKSQFLDSFTRRQGVGTTASSSSGTSTASTATAHRQAAAASQGTVPRRPSAPQPRVQYPAHEPTYNPVHPPSANSRARPLGTEGEVCPHCSATFDDVVALISHVESYHPSTSGHQQRSTPQSGAREVCPQCGLSFQDITALISHVEQRHGQPGLTVR
ncbi:hypothetical protein CYMTET_46896 [Cymbomonas tetramitiformis]|uniref:AN1-type domain-containing protein n=1 Tax=Cymbomonas tetramitiformis TaxID=36881 RepID=A0AAE0BX93_9CHLO|nr:hypothetical protein CYMTET_46896 [Cymbomonas tetramitiformis]